jgi:phage terminase large subunit-like protein
MVDQCIVGWAHRMMREGCGKLERLAYERAERDHAREGEDSWPYRYDATLAERPIQFIGRYIKCTSAEWMGQPLVLGEWQEFCIRETFGWVRKDDGTRRFTTMWVEIARKNGKSQFAAALALYMLIADSEPSPEIYSTATKRTQAAITWGMAAKMVKQHPALKLLVEQVGGRSFDRAELMYEGNDGKFVPLGADSETLDGLSPSVHVCDEVHAHKDSRVWTVVETGMGARRQPLTIAITTAGISDETMVGYATHVHIVQVLEGVLIDEEVFGFIASADEGVDWFSEQAWIQANPHYPKTPKKRYLEKEALNAKARSDKLNDYRRLTINQWVDQSKVWLDMDKWRVCGQKTIPLTELFALPATIGVDLSCTNDLTAMVAAFPVGSDAVAVILKAYMPDEMVKEHAKRGRHYWTEWAQQGWLTVTPGAVIDYSRIHADGVQWSRELHVEELCFDPWNATDITTKWAEQDGLTCTKVRQGFQSMNSPTKLMEVLVNSGKLYHFNNPILTFCARNAVVSMDAAGNIKPDKSKAVLKIDAIVAAIIALSGVDIGQTGMCSITVIK